MITQAALNYKLSDKNLPQIEYTDQERATWKFCYGNLKQLFKTNACSEFKWTIDQFEKHVGFTDD